MKPPRSCVNCGVWPNHPNCTKYARPDDQMCCQWTPIVSQTIRTCANAKILRINKDGSTHAICLYNWQSVKEGESYPECGFRGDWTRANCMCNQYEIGEHLSSMLVSHLIYEIELRMAACNNRVDDFNRGRFSGMKDILENLTKLRGNHREKLRNQR